MEETIIIPFRRYLELLDKEKVLDHLYYLGVDNWEGYQVPYEEEEEDDEDGITE